MLGTAAIIVFVLFALGSGKSSKKKDNGNNGYPPGPGPGPGPGPSPDKTLEDALAVMCGLFTTTHAAAPPDVLAAHTLAALGVPAEGQFLADVLAIAERMYAGEITCEDDGEEPYAPGSKYCANAGRYYNAAIFPSVQSVQTEFRLLGFALPPEPTPAQYKLTVEKFQAIARSLKGEFVGQSKVDGVPGACTLIDLEVARRWRKKGIWPYTLAGGMGSLGGPPKIPTMTATPAAYQSFTPA